MQITYQWHVTPVDTIVIPVKMIRLVLPATIQQTFASSTCLIFTVIQSKATMMQGLLLHYLATSLNAVDILPLFTTKAHHVLPAALQISSPMLLTFAFAVILDIGQYQDTALTL